MNEGLFAGGAGTFMLLQGAFMGLLILFSYFFGYYLEYGYWHLGQSVDGMTMAFLTTNLVEMFRAFTTRSLTESVFSMKSQNWWLWGAFVWTFILTCGVIFVPAFRAVFNLSHISMLEFSIALCLALSIIPVSELTKWHARKNQ